MPQLGIIFFENKAASTVTSTSAPTLSSLGSTYQKVTSYTGTGANSFVNYTSFAAASFLSANGNVPGGSGDKDTPSPASVGFAGASPNIFDQAIAAGLSWKNYAEDVVYWDTVTNSVKDFYTGGTSWKTDSNVNTSNLSGGGGNLSWFVNRHTPGCFFTSTAANPGSSPSSGLVDFRTPTGLNKWAQGSGTLLDDIANSSLPDFFVIDPNLPNGGHGYVDPTNGGASAKIQNVDGWLGNTSALVHNRGTTVGGSDLNFPGVTTLLGAMRPGSTLFVTFDNDGTGPTGVSGGVVVYTVICGPGSTYTGKSSYTTASNHFILLNTVESFFNLSKLPTTGYTHSYSQAGSDAYGGGYTALTSTDVLPFIAGSSVLPTPPTVTVGTVTSNSIALSWSGATDVGGPGIGSYQISRSTPTNGSYALLTTITAPTTTFTDTSLTPGTKYFYKIKSVDTANAVSNTYSNEVNATTTNSTGTLSTAPASNTPGMYSSTYDPTTNKDGGRVWGGLELNGVVYVCGDGDHTLDFSSGTKVDRTTTPYMFAYNKSTGAVLQTWKPAPNNTVYGMQFSDDKSLIYFWGQFTTVGATTQHCMGAFAPLSGVTDTTAFALDASVPNISISGNIKDMAWQSGHSRAWAAGDFTALGGNTHTGVARLKVTSGVWGVDSGFTGAVAGAASGNIKCMTAKSDGSIVVVGGFITNAIQAFNGTTGASATWNFQWTAAANQSCISMTSDDTYVLVTGDFGGANEGSGGGGQGLLLDWTGSGPNFTGGALVTGSLNNINVGTSNSGCYWYVTCDGNIQACAKIVINGIAYAIFGHHGDFAAPSKNVINFTSNTANRSEGVFAFQWDGTVASDSRVFCNPPSFGQNFNVGFTAPLGGDVLKTWFYWQDPITGSLHTGGDYCAASGAVQTAGSFLPPGGASIPEERYARFDYPGWVGDTTPPTPPTSVTATALTPTSIQVDWSGAADDADGTGIASYNIYRATGAGSYGAPVNVSATPYIDSSVIALTTYHYKIKAIDGAGNVSLTFSPVGTATTPSGVDTQPPTVPTNLTATATGISTIHLSWTASTDNVSVASYNIYRDGAASPVGNVLSPNITFDDSGLATNSTHTYAVSALDGAGNESAQSATATATTQSSVTVPNPLLWFNFDNVVSSTITDDSGGGHNGTGVQGNIGSAASWTPTTASFGIGKAASFNGGQFQRVEVTNTGSFLDVVTTGFTICVWVYLDNSVDTDPVHQRYEMMEKNGCFWFNCREDSNPLYRLRVGGFFGPNQVANTSFTGNTSIVPLTWTHTACTYDGAHLITYINGVVDKSVAQTGVVATGATVSGVDEKLVVGAKHQLGHNAGGNVNTELLQALWNGQLDDFRLWSTALNQSQIQTVMNQNQSNVDTQPPTDPTGLTSSVAGATEIDLSWTASTDNVGVTQYKIYKVIP